jgi:hypothetical protein
MTFGHRPVGGGEGDGSLSLARRLASGDLLDAAVTFREGDDPGHEAFGRNFHPATAACGRILHHALPHHAYYPYYCCLTPATAIGSRRVPVCLINDNDKEHVHETGDSDVRHVARRHFHAPGGYGLGSQGPG